MSFRIIPLITLPLLGLVGIGAAVAGTGMAFRHGPPFPPPSFADHRAMGEAAIADLLGEIDATEAQRSEITAILDAAHEQVGANHPDPEEHHAQVRALLTAETIDREAMEAMRVEAIDHMDAGSQLLVETLADVAEVLSVEQRQQVAELVERRFAD